MLIVFEGRDRCGKKTHSEKLFRRFEPDYPTKLLSFPRYDTPLGRLILANLKKSKSERTPNDDLELQCLMLTDKYDALPDIEDASEKGIVILDRWRPSAECYGQVDGLEVGWLARTQARLPHGHINFLIDIDTKLALERRPEHRDHYESDMEKQEKLRQIYVDYWWKNSDNDRRSTERWFVIDNSPPVDKVAQTIWETVMMNASLTLRRFQW